MSSLDIINISCACANNDVNEENGENKVYYFSSNDCDCSNWTTTMTELWNNLCNKEDRPVQRNISNQMPLINIYDESFSLNKYISLNELCGEEILSNATFGNMDGIDTKEIFIWSSCDPQKILGILNSQLEAFNCKYRLRCTLSK